MTRLRGRESSSGFAEDPVPPAPVPPWWRGSPQGAGTADVARILIWVSNPEPCLEEEGAGNAAVAALPRTSSLEGRDVPASSAGC